MKLAKNFFQKCQRHISSKLVRAVIFLFIAGGLITRNFHFANLPFYDWDEGIYAQVAWEILQNISLLTTFNGTVWLNKPPLVHALIAGAFGLFGRSEFWARLVMIFFALVLLILLYRLSKKLLSGLFPKEFSKSNPVQNELLVLTPVFALASTPLFIERATYLNTDIPLAIGWIGYFLYKDRYLWKLFFLCLGTLTKSLLGFYPALFELMLIRTSSFTREKLIRSLVLFVVPLTWHIISFIIFGTYFLKAHINDQVVKRVVSPIELHFGGTYFYPRLLIDNIGPLLFFLFVGYIISLPIAFRLFRLTKERLKNKNLWNYFILLSPLPFFVLLTVMKSKIPWYLVSVLPLFALGVGYGFMYIKDRLLRTIALTFIIAYFLFQFIPQTYLLKPEYEVPVRTTIAQCIGNYKNGDTLAFLVDQAERDIKNVLEAAQLQTETSFVYGGSPSFVFYSQKKVRYFYDAEEFFSQHRDYPVLVMSDADFQNDSRFAETTADYERSDCSQDQWIVLTK